MWSVSLAQNNKILMYSFEIHGHYLDKVTQDFFLIKFVAAMLLRPLCLTDGLNHCGFNQSLSCLRLEKKDPSKDPIELKRFTFLKF